MRIDFLRNIEKLVKAKYYRSKIRNKDFTIISNNCWGTFIYKKFGLAYQSPFVNLMLFAPDYIDLLENFSLDTLQKLTFISHENSKYVDEMKKLGIYDTNYPLGLLDGKYELNFLHYKTEEEARTKWLTRCKRINLDKMIIKFSDGDLCNDSLAIRFDALPYKHKLFFSAKSYSNLNSNIQIKKFSQDLRVRDEWKYFEKHLDIYQLINKLSD